jgi:ArsR family transcriptional regulator
LVPLASEQARQRLKALSDPIRLRLIEALATGERCVCDLTGELGLAQSRLSFHLKVLKDAELIEAREDGRWVYYRLNPLALEQLRCWLSALQASCNVPAVACRDPSPAFDSCL